MNVENLVKISDQLSQEVCQRFELSEDGWLTSTSIGTVPITGITTTMSWTVALPSGELPKSTVEVRASVVEFDTATYTALIDTTPAPLTIDAGFLVRGLVRLNNQASSGQNGVNIAVAGVDAPGGAVTANNAAGDPGWFDLAPLTPGATYTVTPSLAGWFFGDLFQEFTDANTSDFNPDVTLTQITATSTGTALSTW